MALIAAAFQRSDIDRNGDLGAELLRLGKCACSQCMAGDASGKAKVILDARRCAGLPTERARIQHQHRQAFGRGIHCRRQAGRASADHGHVEDPIRIELRRHAEARGKIDVGRVLQQRAVRAQHDRQLIVVYAKPLDEGLTIATVGHVEQRIRMAVTGEKTLQSHQRGLTRPTSQQGAGTFRNQHRTAQKKSPHDDLADLGRADDQRA